MSREPGDTVGTVDPVPEAWTPGTRAQVAFDAILLLVVVGYVRLALDLGFGTSGRAGAGFFPVVAASICGSFLVIDLARMAMTRRTVPRGGSGRVFREVWLILLSIAAYIGLVDVIGHAVTATIITWLLVATLGSRRWPVIGLVGVLAGFGTDLVFGALLGLDLPAGQFDIGFASWI